MTLIPDKDHPRSRGVYAFDRLPVSGGGGSSPLARGLPSRAATAPRRLRIIPARAGFTMIRVTLGYDTEDHPRSRGVYILYAVCAAICAGSSPLARGLPGRGNKEISDFGIIPARAGFTNPYPHKGTDHKDHPRSRGVYPVAGISVPSRRGSSPLARGLLFCSYVCSTLWGIIPARAGFTVMVGLIVVSSEDHPRSRGVYLGEVVGEAAGEGSSPLARGLRRASRRAFRTFGIIPARAGFTDGEVPAGEAGWDHPRSRGVYRVGPPGDGPALGSSPLARGLRRRRRTRCAAPGIIPARAGFTVTQNGPSVSC